MDDLSHALQLQLRSWNILDWFIAASLVVSTCAGFIRGLIASLVSLLGLGIGILAATIYTPRIAPLLHGWLGSPLTARLVAFCLILAAVYFLVTAVGRLLRSVCRAVGLGFFDRVAGASFGLVRGALLLLALAVPLKPYLLHSAEGHSSLLLPYLREVSDGVFSVVSLHMRHDLSVGHISL